MAPTFSILLPSMNLPTSARTRKVWFQCLTENTTVDYEVLLSVHSERDAYACHNDLAAQASGEYLIFAEDDKYFAPGWDKAFMAYMDMDRLVIGSLVESGITPVHAANITAFFGDTPENYQRKNFEEFVANRQATHADFWSFPWCIHRETFLHCGGFNTDLLGTPQGDMLDLMFWQDWIAAGFTQVRAPAFCYHLMRWTSRDYMFGKKREA